MKKPVIKSPGARAAAADAFVAGPEAATKEPIKRLTIDLTPEQHRAFKARAATEGTTMVEIVRAWIDSYLK